MTFHNQLVVNDLSCWCNEYPTFYSFDPRVIRYKPLECTVSAISHIYSDKNLLLNFTFISYRRFRQLPISPIT
jgi:hypothetical protein